MLGVILNLLSIVPDIILTFVIVTWCTKRPKLELIGMSSEYWLGPECTDETILRLAEESRDGEGKAGKFMEYRKRRFASTEEELKYIKVTFSRYIEHKAALDTQPRNLKGLDLSAAQKRYIKRADAKARRENHLKTRSLGIESAMKKMGVTTLKSKVSFIRTLSGQLWSDLKFVAGGCFPQLVGRR
jgi:hypothetical protein